MSDEEVSKYGEIRLVITETGADIDTEFSLPEVCFWLQATLFRLNQQVWKEE